MYDWMTANDEPDRDPVKWTLESLGSDGQWAVLDAAHGTTAFAAPSSRESLSRVLTLRSVAI